MKKTILILFLFLFTTTILLSCQDNVIFKDYKSIPQEEWQVQNPVSFNVNIPQNQEYLLSIIVRHTTDYEMANLWCFIDISDSTQTTLYKDTLNIILAEPDGRWLGKGHSIKTIQTPINVDNIELYEGIHTIKIEQGMRIKSLKGVKDVGITLEKKQ